MIEKKAAFTLIFFMLSLNLVHSDGVTVTSVSSTAVFTKTTDPSTVYWLVNTQLNGGGQYITGVVTPDTVKNYMSGKAYTKQPFNIEITANNEQIFYEVRNEGYPIYEYSLSSTPPKDTCFLGQCIATGDPDPCPAGTTWDLPVGKTVLQFAKIRYCVTKQTVATKGSYENPFISFTAKIRTSAGGIVKEKTICSGAVSGCDGTSVDFDSLGVAQWTGNLVTGDSAPNQNNFVAIKRSDTNRWQIGKKSDFDAYNPYPATADSALNSFSNLFPGYSDVNRAYTEITNAITPANNAAVNLINNQASFTSSQFTTDSNTGKVAVTLNRRLMTPNILFRIRADWVGVVIPTGQPKILSVTSDKFNGGESGTVNIQIQNIGEAAGTFSAMLVNCDPFIQSVSGQTARKTFQPNDADTIQISVSGGTMADDYTKSCSVKVYDVNDPSISATSDLTLQQTKPKICVPGKFIIEGKMIKQCNEQGTAVNIVRACDYGVESDSQGDLNCVAPPQPVQSNPLQPSPGAKSCNSNGDCPKYSACSLETKTCYDCSDIHCCPTGKIWSSSNSACVSPSQFVGVPIDTSCGGGWPNHQGKLVSINEQNSACDIFEVTDQKLLLIAKEVASCYENSCSGTCHSMCTRALKESGADKHQDANSFKAFAGYYITYGLGPTARYMHNYFYAEINCGSGSGSCTPTSGYNSNVQQLTCRGPVGKPAGWASDYDMSANSCMFSDLPAHASINILQTGTCVDYSIALTTLLRMVGYSKSEVYSVNAPNHEYNLVKFPGNYAWSIVDTVGNAGNPIGDTWGWNSYKGYVTHCDYVKEGCSNDAGPSTCPDKSEVIGC